MKLSKATVAMGLAFVMISTTNVFAFTDVKANDQMSQAINLMAEYKIVNGYEDGTFKPEKEVTRAEFVKMTNCLFSYKDKAISENFKDVNEKDWFYEDILKAMNQGYILGYTDGTFKPNDKVTKEQICIILDRILNLEKTVAKKDLAINDKVSAWAANSINRVISCGIMNLDADGKFKATAPADRGTVALAYAKIVEKKMVTLSKNDTTKTEGTVSGGTSGVGGSTGGTTKPTQPDKEKPSTEIIETMKLASAKISTTGARYLTSDDIKRSDLVPYIENISSEINKYVNNPNYDLKAAMRESKKNYSSLPEKDQKLLKSAVTLSFDLGNDKEYKALEEVAKFFGIDINKVK